MKSRVCGGKVNLPTESFVFTSKMGLPHRVPLA